MMTGPDVLAYTFTIEDPDSFTRPWTAESVLTRTSSQMFEFACHEGNYSMENSSPPRPGAYSPPVCGTRGASALRSVLL